MSSKKRSKERFFYPSSFIVSLHEMMKYSLYLENGTIRKY